jgi:tetratricopeptide (TPR) repeat protein
MEDMIPTKPAWAVRIAQERKARGWSQAQAVANLRATYELANRKPAGSQESLVRQWKEWEAGRVRPKHWAPYVAATLGTVAQDLFPVEGTKPAQLLVAAGMNTAELVARLQRSNIDNSTIKAIEFTVDRLATEYRYRPVIELRAESQDWLREITLLLGKRLTYAQHGAVLAAAAKLALLVGCVEYDAGERVAAETTRRYALELGTELGHPELIGWAHELDAWFALTSGDYQRTIAATAQGIEAAGDRGVSVQLSAQAAKAWARLGNVRQAEVALDRGRRILQSLAAPTNPDDHFAIDATKWHFYEMDAYRNLGNDSLASVYAEEVLRVGVASDGTERSPMRNSEARLTLGLVAARNGDPAGAVAYGRQATCGNRQSLPSLLMVGGELVRSLEKTSRHHPDVAEFRHTLKTIASRGPAN